MKLVDIGFIVLETVVILCSIIIVFVGLVLALKPDYNQFDVNRDGVVDAQDYVLLRNYIFVYEEGEEI